MDTGLRQRADIIDEFLLDADKNNDGFLNFKEYLDSMQHEDEDENGNEDVENALEKDVPPNND